jgi:hypothetical protein
MDPFYLSCLWWGVNFGSEIPSRPQSMVTNGRGQKTMKLQVVNSANENRIRLPPYRLVAIKAAVTNQC